MNYIRELELEKAHAESMAAAARLWMHRAQEAERTLAIVLYAAKDEIVVTPKHVLAAPNVEVIRYDALHDMTVRFRGRLKGEKPSGEA